MNASCEENELLLTKFSSSKSNICILVTKLYKRILELLHYYYVSTVDKIKKYEYLILTF